jgi:hypothetical protein
LSLNRAAILSIYSNYLTVKDTIKVTQRSIKVTLRSLSKESPSLHDRTIFENMKPKEVAEMIKTSEKEFSDLIVLALFANFELQLRDEILEKSSILKDIIPAELGKEIDEFAQKEIEKWRIRDIIDLFKFAVDGNTRGEIKQILRYRNWVAHGKNPDPAKSVNKTEPKVTYEMIVEFIDQIQRYYDNLS